MDPFVVGIIAGTLCTFSFLPQVLLLLRTKNTKDISLVTFSLLSVGVFLWLLYGLMIKALPIILANAITLIMTLLIVIMKLRYR